MARLSDYGGRRIETDGIATIEMVDPNDNAGHRCQYRRRADGIERRVLACDGGPMDDGSPWEPCDVTGMIRMRGRYHPILDELGF